MKKVILVGVLVFTTGILAQTKVNKPQPIRVSVEDISTLNGPKELASGD